MPIIVYSQHMGRGNQNLNTKTRTAHPTRTPDSQNSAAAELAKIRTRKQIILMSRGEDRDELAQAFVEKCRAEAKNEKKPLIVVNMDVSCEAESIRRCGVKQKTDVDYQISYVQIMNVMVATRIAKGLVEANHKWSKKASKHIVALEQFLDANYNGEEGKALEEAVVDKVRGGVQQFDLSSFGVEVEDWWATGMIAEPIMAKIRECAAEAEILVMFDRVDAGWDDTLEAHGVLGALSRALYGAIVKNVDAGARSPRIVEFCGPYIHDKVYYYDGDKLHDKEYRVR